MNVTCAEKVVFETAGLARAAALLAEQAHGIKLRAYRCKHCGMWHLASR